MEKIKVTATDIRKGRKHAANPEACPISRAATRHFGVLTSCGYENLTVREAPIRVYEVSRAAKRFQSRLFNDRKADVKPFTFVATRIL